MTANPDGSTNNDGSPSGIALDARPWPTVTLALLEPFVDDRGIATTADHTAYTADDNGRALALSVNRTKDPYAATLAESALAQLIHTDRSNSGDAVLGLAAAATRAPWTHLRRVSRELFESSRSATLTGVQSWASAALGAAVILRHATYSSVAAFVIAKHAESELADSNDLPAALHARIELAALSLAGDLSHELELLASFRRRVLVQGYFESERDGSQQSRLAADAVAAFAAAFRLTDDREWAVAAVLTAEWFVGRNSIGMPLFESRKRVVHDAINDQSVSPTVSAAGVLSFLDAIRYGRSLRR